jgi:hypothetical protein
MGKSWLLGMFAHEAANRKLPLVQIDFADRQTYDPFKLIQRCRDVLGHSHFEPLNRKINEVTQDRRTLALLEGAQEGAQAGPITVSIGSENRLEKSTLIMSGIGNKSFNLDSIVMPGDVPFQRQAIEDQFNATFFDCLTRRCSESKIVFMFDSYELTSVHAEHWLPGVADQWIVSQLLDRIRDGRLPNAIAVLAGRRTRPFGVEWNRVLRSVSLGPLQRDDYDEYFCKRLGLSTITDSQIDVLWQVGAGIPQMLGLFGDRLGQAKRPGDSFDDW